MNDFSKWWHETGSGIAALPNHDHEEHAERVAQRAWDAASDQLLRERDEALMERDGARSARRELESKLIRHKELVDFVIKEASGLIITNVSANKTSAYWDAVTTLRRFEFNL